MITKLQPTLGDVRHLIGKQRILAARPGLYILVTVLDVRTVYNRVDALVTPVAGHGSAWVDSGTLKEAVE